MVLFGVSLSKPHTNESTIYRYLGQDMASFVHYTVLNWLLTVLSWYDLFFTSKTAIQAYCHRFLISLYRERRNFETQHSVKGRERLG